MICIFKKGKRLINEKNIQYLVTVYYLTVACVPGISYLIWGTVVYGVSWHWLRVGPKSQPVSFTRVPYA